MDINDELDRLDAEIEATETERLHLEARLAGLRAQRDTLARAAAATPAARPSAASVSLRLLSRTDAIVEVLRAADRPMSINDVLQALVRGGREETNYQVIASTLAMLAKTGRVAKPTRGYYQAAS